MPYFATTDFPDRNGVEVDVFEAPDVDSPSVERHHTFSKLLRGRVTWAPKR